MIPILFTENSNTFTTNGIGRLSDVISCVVTEERNGQFELAMVYPADGKHFEDITLRALIVADASPAQTKQPFRIYKISKPINGKVTINAQHISYDLSKNVSMPFSVSASSSACANALNGLKTNAVETCPFTFSTNVTTVASFAQLAPATIRQMMGGVEGSVLDQFGGEYKFDKFTVYLQASRGTTKNIPLRYGKNITDIKQEENIANTITGIVPFWSDSEGGDIVTLPEKVLHSSNASSYSSYLTIPVDFSSDFEEKPTESQLRTHGQAYINKYGIGIPKVSIDVSFVNLPDTEEYKGLLNLLQLELCDTIPVEFSKLGISASAKVVKTEYNTLKDRYDRITVGEVGATLAKTITGVSDSITGLADATKTNFAKAGIETDVKISTATANFPTRNEVQQDIDNATAWLTSTDGVMRAMLNSNNEWQGLIFMDETTTATTGNCMRLNKNGWGFSTTGWNGTFYQGVTLDGRALFGGTNFPSLTVYDNSNNVIFQADKTKIIWNADNSSMNSSGTLSANSAQLTNVNITDGSILMQSVSGDLLISNGTIAFEAGTANESSISPVGTNGMDIESDALRLQTKTSGSGSKSIEMWQGTNNPLLINSVGGKIQLQAGDDIEISSSDEVKITATTAVNVESTPIKGIGSVESGGILEETTGEVRFGDLLNNHPGNLTLENDNILLSSNNIYVRKNRGSGTYYQGTTGTFSLRAADGGTYTLEFVDGILI